MVAPVALRCAAETLIEEHLNFARALARRLAVRLPASVDVEELESDAFLGLIMAARTFDPARDVRFRTYAARRIEGQMLDGLRERNACRRRYPAPHFASLDAPVTDAEGHVTPFVQTLAADTKPIGRELEDADEVRFLESGLDRRSRRLLNDYYLKGMLQEQIARRAGVTASAVSLRLKRARMLARRRPAQ